MSTTPPGWLPDPTGRHEYRYWDGTRWSDDVSDGGATSIDPVEGPAPQTSGYGPGYGHAYGQAPGSYSGDALSAAPRGSAPSPGLLIGLGLLVVVLIVGIVFFVTTKDDDGTETTSNTDPTGDTTEGTETTETTDATVDAGDIGAGSEDAMAEMAAEALVTASEGVLTNDEATCLAEGMIDQIGLDRLMEAGAEVAQGGVSNPFDIYTEEELTTIAGVIYDCVPADKIDELAPVFGDFVEESAAG